MKIALIILLVCLYPPLFAQRSEIGFHLISNYGNQFQLAKRNTDINPQNTVNMAGGISYLLLSKSSWGIRGGTSIGYHAQAYTITGDSFRFPLFTYPFIGLKAEPVYRFKALQNEFEFFGGGELRIYFSDGTSSTSVVNSERSYQFEISHFKRSSQLNAFGGLSLNRVFNERNAISIGLLKNFSLQQFNPGTLIKDEASGRTQTSFASSSNSWGVRVMYSYLLKNL